MTTLTLGQSPRTLARLRAVLEQPCTVELAPAAWTAVERGAAVVAASGWAPPMPPRPAVRIHLPDQSPP